MRVIASLAVAVVLASSGVAAQAPKPTPGPEHKRLGHFTGQWKFEGEAKESPLGPAGKNSGTETCEWFAGGFQLVCHSKGTSPRGPATGISVMSYDPGRKAYTYYAASSLGDNIFVRGNVSGNVWTFEDTVEIEGQAMKIRATVTEESPTVSVFKLEAGPATGQLMVIEEGRSTKQK